MRDEKGSAAGCKLVRRRARARRKSWNGEAGFQISRSIGSRRNSAKLGPLKTRDIVCCVFGIRASLIACGFHQFSDIVSLAAEGQYLTFILVIIANYNKSSQKHTSLLPGAAFAIPDQNASWPMIQISRRYALNLPNKQVKIETGTSQASHFFSSQCLGYLLSHPHPLPAHAPPHQQQIPHILPSSSGCVP